MKQMSLCSYKLSLLTVLALQLNGPSLLLQSKKKQQEDVYTANFWFTVYFITDKC